MAEAVTVGLPVGKIGLQKQAGNLGLLGLENLDLMLGLHGTPREYSRSWERQRSAVFDGLPCFEGVVAKGMPVSLNGYSKVRFLLGVTIR